MLIRNAKVVTLEHSDSFGLIAEGVVAMDGSRIAWVGPERDLPDRLQEADAYDAQGRLVTPALIDCHTHIVFGGTRAAEFERRLQGASYSEIAQAGGGILSTVAATRMASEETLLTEALRRVDALIAEGVTLIEVKSGYGLDIDTELKMLRVARAIALHRAIEVRTSFLGAHAVPPDYAGRPDAYLEEQCLPALRAAHAQGLVDAVDGFCEGIAFDRDQIARVFAVARDLGLPVKLHADQLSDLGGAALAGAHAALSADHLEYTSAQGIAAMARAGTVAVLLPGAFYTLGEVQKPPVPAFRTSGVAMALATDCNPGSSPLSSVLLAMNMGCTLFGLTPLEALLGVTAHAAQALGMTDRGRIVSGSRADLCLWDAEHPAELAYRIGFNPLHARVFKGAL